MRIAIYPLRDIAQRSCTFGVTRTLSADVSEEEEKKERKKKKQKRRKIPIRYSPHVSGFPIERISPPRMRPINPRLHY